MSIKEMLAYIFILNMDLFIISISLGTRKRNAQEIGFGAFLLTLLQGIMIVSGYYLGTVLGTSLGDKGENVGAVIIILVGYETMRQSFAKDHRGTGNSNMLMVLAGASLEEFITAVSVGTQDINFILFLFLFIVITYLMNLAGLRIGSAVRKQVNLSMDLLIGVTLFIMGLLNILKIL